ncbi:MAG: FHA domain-containing protein, partial [Tannerella sp.]|nr:FHA domain-containing protein [Tannerella sp.]
MIIMIKKVADYIIDTAIHIPLGMYRSVEKMSPLKSLACRRYATFLLLLTAISANAQTLVGDFDTKNYPEVSFVWNEYNPGKLDTAQFTLTLAGAKIPFRLENVPANDSVQPAKSILFLWEDLNHAAHAGQSEFTRAVLQAFLNDTTFLPEDKFNVAIFDRKGGNDLGTSIHTWLSEGFTTDRQQLSAAVRDFKPKYDFFSNQANSELYMAIEEGIERLQKEPTDHIRAIVVFTAGSNQDSYGGRNSIDENRALSLKIPVYVVKYPIKGCEHCSNIDLICQKTYGQEITTSDSQVATDLLKQCYTKMSARHHGQDYRITFTADYPRDGQQHSILLNVSGKEYTLSFTAPAFSLKHWVETHKWQSALILVGLLLVICVALLFLRKSSRKRKQHLAQLEQQQQAAQALADKNRKDLEGFKQKVEKDNINNRKEDFARLMQTKNLLPRLQYSYGKDGARTVSTITKPEFTIGRDADNDLVIVNDSVSRHHAKILFNGSAFEIQDLGSTNKVIVNGAFTERSA